MIRTLVTIVFGVVVSLVFAWVAFVVGVILLFKDVEFGSGDDQTTEPWAVLLWLALTAALVVIDVVAVRWVHRVARRHEAPSSTRQR
jgi:hypothetical protein